VLEAICVCCQRHQRHETLGSRLALGYGLVDLQRTLIIRRPEKAFIEELRSKTDHDAAGLRTLLDPKQ